MPTRNDKKKKPQKLKKSKRVNQENQIKKN
jgi:hypothetical protein